MRPILLSVLLGIMSGSAFGISADRLPNGEVWVEEQNGKLLQPVMDPKTNKYTYDAARGQQIVEQYYDWLEASEDMR